MTAFKDKTVFISGATRGIGLAIGLKLATEGANIIVTGKTSEPHPKLEGTIHTAAAAIEKAGGRALAIQMNSRYENEIEAAVKKGAAHFGGMDILINNASAIRLYDTEKLTVKHFDLMHQVNTRATFINSKACLPYLKKSKNPHILMLSPPLNLTPEHLGSYLGYALSKFGMSLCVMGLAEEFKKKKIAVNALWPRTIIATAAISNNFGGKLALRKCRKPDIVADAAFFLLKRASGECSGNFFTDEQVLASEGITDLAPYSFKPGASLIDDLFL